VATSPQPTSAILIADGDAATRKKVARVVESAGFATAQASTGQGAPAFFQSDPPACRDPRALACGLLGLRGVLRDQFGEAVPILFLSASRSESCDRVAGLLLGADDYIAKPFAGDELLARARRLVQPALPPTLVIPSVLTKRELEVLGLLAEGLAQRDIAERLARREKTVGSHIERILSKLGVRSRAQAVALAFRQELVGVSIGTAAFSSHRPKNLARAAQTT
jgi:DNA-binding NarL/FixJ family response regulator